MLEEKINRKVYGMRNSPTDKYSTHDYHNAYMEEALTNGYSRIHYTVFKDITNQYFKHIADELVNQGRIYVLPSRFGSVQVRKKKLKVEAMNFDYYTYSKTNKGAWHFNEHTNGYNYSFYWDKRKFITRNCVKYQIHFTRANKRLLAKLLKHNQRDYLE